MLNICGIYILKSCFLACPKFDFALRVALQVEQELGWTTNSQLYCMTMSLNPTLGLHLGFELSIIPPHGQMELIVDTKQNLLSHQKTAKIS